MSSTLTEADIAETLKVLGECRGNQSEAARRLGMSRGTLLGRMHRAAIDGHEVPAPTVTAPAGRSYQKAPPAPSPSVDADMESVALTFLRKRGGAQLEEIATALGTTKGVALDTLEAMARGHHMLHQAGETWSLGKAPMMGTDNPTGRALTSDAYGKIRIAAVGDTHLGSKYERLDCLNDFYDEVAKRGISLVLHAGNWVDGEAPFNKHDLIVHGADAQLAYLAEHYPARDGVETWAITGADHEGWLARREGVDIGRYAENVMHQAGRTDWTHMGFMECFLPLVHGSSGAECKLSLMHPGGGSAYATSYAPQKIVEGFDGGDKPAALLLGHYHKASYNLIRNVHVIQVGCFQDQTVFMRQKKIAAHLGGYFIDYTLDPETGAILECTSTFRNYFVKGYYQDRWSQHGPVAHAPRSALP